MAWNLEISSNYFKATNTVSLIERKYNKSEVRIAKATSASTDFTFKENRLVIDGMDNVPMAEILAKNGTDFTDQASFEVWADRNTGGAKASTTDIINTAWGVPKFSEDNSIIHGMFTYGVPVITWYETVNSIIQSSFVNATGLNGKLHLEAGATLNDDTYLRTFRNPRYEPNRGYHYAISAFLPSPTDLGNRRFGYFTSESGAFFSLESGILYAVVRTTIATVTADDKYIIDTTGIDLSKGNLFDIQMQWRGVGNYKFFINQRLVKEIKYVGERVDLTMFNPANPIAFECENLGDNVVLECGCVDVSSEGGKENGKTYGSIGMATESGDVEITGPSTFNTPILVVRSKMSFGGLINTRDTLALLASAYSDQKSLIRIWATRDNTAITLNDQSWSDYGDGHLEFIQYDQPDVVTPMSFDTAKAELIFSSRVDQNTTYATSALFEGRTSIYQTPGETFIFTMHRENGGGAFVGVTYEFAEEI